MKTYTLPHTDLVVSRLAYGSWHLGGGWDDGPPTADAINRADRLIHTAVDAGINFFDLADIYAKGKSDMVVGATIKADPTLRDQIYLQAKCGIITGDDPVRGGPGRYDFSYDHIVGAVETSLRRLHTDYVDVLLLHRPDPLVEPAEVARAFDQLQQSGKVRHFGVSNHTAAQIALLQKHVDQKLIANQVEINLLHHDLIDDGITFNQAAHPYTGAAGTLDYCRLHDIMLQAWSPVAGGKLFNPAADAPVNVRAVANLIVELAQAHDVTPNAIPLAWLLRHPAGIQPIIGTQNARRLRDSCQADNVHLSRQEWYALFIAARGERMP